MTNLYEDRISKLEAEIKELEEGATQQNEVYESEIANLEAENKKLKEEMQKLEKTVKPFLSCGDCEKLGGLEKDEKTGLWFCSWHKGDIQWQSLSKCIERAFYGLTYKLNRSKDNEQYHQAKLATLKERVEKLKTYSIKVGKKPFEPHVETKYYYGKAISLKSIIKLIEEMK